MLNDDQRTVVATVWEAIQRGAGGVFFLDAPGGCGKTFVMNHLLAKVRGPLGCGCAAVCACHARTCVQCPR
jgi:hypothetical protein